MLVEFLAKTKIFGSKITEVTRADVQGLVRNIRQLRTKQVMKELAHHPECLPLILDVEGRPMPFRLTD